MLLDAVESEQSSLLAFFEVHITNVLEKWHVLEIAWYAPIAALRISIGVNICIILHLHAVRELGGLKTGFAAIWLQYV